MVEGEHNAAWLRGQKLPAVPVPAEHTCTEILSPHHWCGQRADGHRCEGRAWSAPQIRCHTYNKVSLQRKGVKKVIKGLQVTPELPFPAQAAHFPPAPQTMMHLQVEPGGSVALDEVLDATPLSLQDVLQWPDSLRGERKGAQGLPGTGGTGLWHHSPCWQERGMTEPGLLRSCASHPKGKGLGPLSAAPATGHPGLACSLSSWWH